MPERGGPTTQDGIHYQNSVAVLAMLDMLAMDPAPAYERVTDVRVEAPEQVDDIVIRHADATAIYQNVKLDLPSGKPWVKLWKQLGAQRTSQGFSVNDRIQVIVANSTQRFEDCVEMAKRAQAEDVNEWVGRLSRRQVMILNGIVKQVGTHEAALAIFQRTTFLHWSREHVDAEFNRRRLAAGGPAELPTTLRDIISAGAGRRTHYRAGPLRRQLALEHKLTLVEPPTWGLNAYREAIKKQGFITIPGTDRSGTVEELFVWPTARDFEADGLRSFEDEDPGYWREPTRDRVDLRDFPQLEFDRVVVVAGPGYGKSALLTALMSGLAEGPFVPVEIPLALLAKRGTNVLSFVEQHLTDEYGLAADWRLLAEQGLLVLLYDGLDEIPASDRTVVLQRIARFSSLYQHCPWLLTARDPAVVNGLPEARQVELTPLSDQDIASFAKVIANHLDSINASHFVNRLRLYPDLNRLARIPLFLTMLLATTPVNDLEPISRSDLIEGYLKTLIAPAEHKIVTDGAPAPSLRTIAQDIAYRKIETQEIGVSESEVRAVIGEHIGEPDAAERIFQLLRINGILQPQGAVRLKFPYPIVQEYLAACHLVQHEAVTLSSRIDNAVSRPWAQVMQFAIELHEDPEPLIQEILERDDDAFATGLRLVGRCVTNGATVTGDTRRSIGRRLVTAWQTSPSRAREAIGRLLCDGFTDDNLEELTEALHKYWLQNSGAGDIVSKISDPELTLSVLKALTERDSSSFKVYRSLRPAIAKVQGQALELVRNLILEVEEDEAREARSSVLTNFEPHPDLAQVALEIARDAGLPLEVRLRAYALVPAPLDPDGAALLHSAITTQQPRLSYEASQLLPKLDDPEKYLLEILGSDEFPDEMKLSLIQSLTAVVADKDRRQVFLAEARGLFKETEIELLSALDVMAAGAGDNTAFARLVADIDKNPLNHVGVTISLLGNYRDAQLAEAAAQPARGRFVEPEDIVRLSNHAVTGMLHRLELDFGFGGLLHHAQPHPGIAHWTALVEDWSHTPNLTELQLIDVLSSASRLGVEDARAQLERAVEGITDPNDPKWNDGHSLGATVGHAVSELRRRKPLLDKELLGRLLRADQFNLFMAGVNALSAHGDRDALERLLAAHREDLGWHEKNELANAIEVLSLKLGLVVTLVDGQYEMPDRAEVS
ncbi:MAG: hypothetical protein QOG53_1086 [Frankiales bacterium]|jgi:hypothetical protein|nr:hypothetical protein [Frankiales bacterium]